MTFGAWLYNIVVIVGTGYVVFGLGRSGWWFVLALGILAYSKDKEGE